MKLISRAKTVNARKIVQRTTFPSFSVSRLVYRAALFHRSSSSPRESKFAQTLSTVYTTYSVCIQLCEYGRLELLLYMLNSLRQRRPTLRIVDAARSTACGKSQVETHQCGDFFLIRHD